MYCKHYDELSSRGGLAVERSLHKKRVYSSFSVILKTHHNVYSCKKKVMFTVFSIWSSFFGHLDSVILTSLLEYTVNFFCEICEKHNFESILFASQWYSKELHNIVIQWWSEFRTSLDVEWLKDVAVVKRSCFEVGSKIRTKWFQNGLPATWQN